MRPNLTLASYRRAIDPAIAFGQPTTISPPFLDGPESGEMMGQWTTTRIDSWWPPASELQPRYGLAVENRPTIKPDPGEVLRELMHLIPLAE